MRTRILLIPLSLLAGAVLPAPAGADADCAPLACPPPACDLAPCGDVCAVLPGGCDAPCGPASLLCEIPEPCADCPRLKAIPGAKACVGGAPDFTYHLNTGHNLNSGQADTLWRMFSGAPAYSKGPNPGVGAWTSAPPATWINLMPGASTWAPPLTARYVVTHFVPANAYAVTLTVEYAADNSVVFTDNPSQQVHSSPTNAFGTLYGFTWGLAPGLHSLWADVQNDHVHTGLLVRATVYGKCKPTGPILGLTACHGGADTFTYRLDTGIDAAGGSLASGGIDPHWTIRWPTVTTAQSYGLTHGLPYWMPTSAATWIGLDATTMDGPAGYTTYAVNFFVPWGATATYGGGFAADNEAVMSLIAWDPPGAAWLVGQTPLNYGFSSPSPFPTGGPTTLGDGYYTLTVQVHNDESYTGLVVSGEVNGKCAEWKDVADPPVE